MDTKTLDRLTHQLFTEARFCEDPARVKQDGEDQTVCSAVASGMMRAANKLRLAVGLEILDSAAVSPEPPRPLQP